jgi:hypothetical protein
MPRKDIEAAREWQREYARNKRKEYLAEHPEATTPRDSKAVKNGATAKTDYVFENEQPKGKTLPEIDFGELNPKQKLFCQARSRYIAYGGARGGGKTHVLRIKAVGGAMHIANLRILIVRREYPELEQSIIIPIRKMVPADLATYNGSMRMMTFWNGSIIKFGHYGANDDIEYQGKFPCPLAR